MQIESPMQTIPPTLAPFFQEYDLKQLDPQRDSATIIERTLRFGTRQELYWLFHLYPRTHITAWVKAWGRYALPEPHLTFWRLLLELPSAE
jgi:Family of unknown function (DUF6922)